MRSGEPTGMFLVPTVEAGPLHELHREVGHAVVNGELVRRDDVRMLELACNLRLGDEALDVEALTNKALVEALERHVTEQVAIRRRMHVSHAAAAELLVDAEVRRRGNLSFAHSSGVTYACAPPTGIDWMT